MMIEYNLVLYPKLLIAGIAQHLAICRLELGLRWLHDRAAEQRHKLAQRARQDPSGRWYG